MNVIFKKREMYMLCKHKLSSCTSSAMSMCDFTHYVIKRWKAYMWLVLSLSTPVQKGRVGWKTPSHFLLQLPNCPTSLFYFFFFFFCKGHLTFFARSLCKHWVGTSSCHAGPIHILDDMGVSKLSGHFYSGSA